MTVIERAEQRLQEEIRQNDLGADNGHLLAYWAAYLDGARAQRKENAQPHWVSVEDELPPPNKTVLVCKIWGDVNGEPHKVITMDSFTISPSDSVIAWMPLPEPPQEVQE